MSFQKKVLVLALGSLAITSLVLSLLFILPAKPEDAIGDYSGLAYSMLFMSVVSLEFLGLLIAAVVMRSKSMSLSKAHREAGNSGEAIKVSRAFDHKARVFLLAAGLVLLVGSSLCLGGANLVVAY